VNFLTRFAPISGTVAVNVMLSNRSESVGNKYFFAGLACILNKSHYIDLREVDI